MASIQNVLPFLLFFFIFVLAAENPASAQSQCLPSTVTIDVGQLIGTTTSLPSATAPVNKFLGVPFAQSPPERFSPPQAPAESSQPINATAVKPACIQNFVYPPTTQMFEEAIFNQPPPQESEDCLYLNVFAPSTPPPPGGRAVMFWIHGGALQFGYGGLQEYDGSAFAAYQDVIVVTINYRTNVFGFPNSPELPVESENLGFLDQRLALDWVQRNIEAFGGDKDKVTIFGQSAGAFSVDALITTHPDPETTPFRAAILQSGQISYNAIPSPPSHRSWNTLAAAANCTQPTSNLTCLRALPATTLQSLVETHSLTFRAIPDNITLLSDPASARAAGAFARVPTLTGSNTDEGRVFEFGQTNLTAFLATNLAPLLAPDRLAALNATYASPVAGSSPFDAVVSPSNPSAFDIIAAYDTDASFQCPAALLATATAAQGVPAWRYLYAASFPQTDIFARSGAWHSSEITQVFQTYYGGPVAPLTQTPLGLLNSTVPPTPAQAQLASYLNKVWADFAKDPAGGPGWSAVGAEDADVAVLGAGGPDSADVRLDSDADVDQGRCEIFAGVYDEVAALVAPAGGNTVG